VATEGRYTVMARRQHAQENREYEQSASAQAVPGEIPAVQDQAQAEADQVPAAAGQVPAAETRPQAALTPEPQAPAPQLTIRRTRVSGLWVAIACFAVVLLLLLIFILQNSHTVDISYFGIHSRLPLGVALLLSAVCGVLLVVLAGTARILQLRTAARRHRRADKQAASQDAQVTRPRTSAP
jgi:uncharacterized integral membrane protein